MTAYQKRLKAWAQENNLTDRICWTSSLNEKEMTWCYQNCSAFVMTSWVEACTNIALEAMSHGFISIAADNPPLPEILEDVAVYYPKGNMYAAINFGLCIGESKWCTYINSDDIIFPHAFANLFKMAKSKMADIGYGNIDYIDQEGRFVHSWNSAPISQISAIFDSKLSPVSQPGTIFRRELYQSLGGFDERFKYAADYDFFLRAYKMNAKFFKYKGDTVAAFRLHEHQISQKYSANMKKEAQESYSQLIQTTSLMHRKYVRIAMYIRNLPNYIIRILRWQQLNGSFVFPKTMTTKKSK